MRLAYVDDIRAVVFTREGVPKKHSRKLIDLEPQYEDIAAEIGAWTVEVQGRQARGGYADLLADGLTRFTGPSQTTWKTRRGAPPVTTRRLDAMTARALGILGGASLLVRPDGVPAAA